MSIEVPSLEEVMPHRGAMLLLERIESWDQEQVVVSAVPRADAWYSDAGAMPSWIGIELIAQAIAAHVGLMARSLGEPPRRGVLLGTRRYRATQAHFQPERELTITARAVYREPSGLGSYDGAITLAGASVAASLATASVTVYEPADFEAFLNGRLP
jgi:predicted hotdog family 3-hydroxylacyl-ACP dehydratase